MATSDLSSSQPLGFHEVPPQPQGFHDQPPQGFHDGAAGGIMPVGLDHQAAGGDGNYGPVRSQGSHPSSSPYQYGGAPAPVSEGKDALALRVKGIQRSNPEDKQRWINWCEMHGKRKHDPAMHDESFLRAFFEALQAGTIPMTGVTELSTHMPGHPPPPAPSAGLGGSLGAQSGKDGMVQRIKTLQRSDPQAKTLWIHYCESRGEKKHDPNVHDEAFLAGFLESHESGATVPEEVGNKLNLVQRIKELQRNNPDGKQKWIEFCESHGYGKHDPNFYKPEFLTSFFDYFEGRTSQYVSSGWDNTHGGQSNMYGGAAWGGDTSSFASSTPQWGPGAGCGAATGYGGYGGCAQPGMQARPSQYVSSGWDGTHGGQSNMYGGTTWAGDTSSFGSSTPQWGPGAGCGAATGYGGYGGCAQPGMQAMVGGHQAALPDKQSSLACAAPPLYTPQLL